MQLAANENQTLKHCKQILFPQEMVKKCPWATQERYNKQNNKQNTKQFGLKGYH